MFLKLEKHDGTVPRV